jgi:tetratricopeptide (TPR) repeat protein
MAHLAMGTLKDAIVAAQDALTTAREAGDRSREATSLSYLGILHAWLAKPVQARAHFQAAMEIAEAIGDRRRATYVKEFEIVCDYFEGEWGEGIRKSEELLPNAAGLTPLEAPYVRFFLGDFYSEIGDRERAVKWYRSAASFETLIPWKILTSVARLNAARIERDREAIERALADVRSLVTGVFVPNEIQLLGPVADALLDVGNTNDLRQLVEERRPAVERFGAAWVQAILALIEARMAMYDGDRAATAAKLDEALRLAESEPNVVVLRRVLETRVQFFNNAEDRAALRRVCEKIAAGLPDDLRTIFLNSPRVAPLMRASA